MAFIYKITNTITKKCYIGETVQKNPLCRWRRHINSVKTTRGCPALKAAIKKYGIDKFKFEVILICATEDRHKYEKEYIKLYNSQVPNGYNILPGGQYGGGRLGIKHTDEAKQKMRDAVKKFHAENPNYYETYRERHRAVMQTIDISTAVRNSEKFRKAVEEGRVGGKAHRNKKDSSDLYNKLCYQVLLYENIINSCNTVINRLQNMLHLLNQSIEIDNTIKSSKSHITIHADKTKTKISESLKAYYRNTRNDNIQKHQNSMANARGRKISQYDKNNIHISTYISIADAARKSGIGKSSIQHALSGKHATSGGYIWRYADEKSLKTSSEDIHVEKST